MHALDHQRHAPSGLSIEAVRAAVLPIQRHPFVLTVLAGLGALLGLTVASLLASDPREAGVYAVACLMIGGGIVLGRQTRADERALALEAERAAVRDSLRDEVRDEVRSVAHDLRAPLLTVSSYLELIAQGHFGDISPEAQAALRQCATVTGRAQTVVETTLRARSAEADVAAALDPVVNLGHVVSDVLDALTGSMREHRAEVAVAGRLPAVRGDETALFRVFENLLQNAMKYGAPGVPPRIGVTWRRIEGGEVEVSVRDNGRGIAAEQREAILQSGVRGDASPGGFGLGLPTAARLVSRMGGTLTIDSRCGSERGTVVRVTLPGA